MSTALLEQAGHAREPPNGGVPARRAVIRWAWRLFRREWRQQLLVLALITVAVAATFVGAAVATNSQPRPTRAFGTAPTWPPSGATTRTWPARSPRCSTASARST